MSWLARSIVNSLKGDDDEDELQKFSNNQPESTPSSSENEEYDDEDTTRGVKEDLSELTKTLTRQFWGVASFLAPPPPDEAQIERSNPTGENESAAESLNIGGIRNDLAEIGGKFRSGISMLSSTKAVSEISKIASNLLQFDIEDEEAVGINEEVVAFATNLSMHPETWTDFPLMSDHDYRDEFNMSEPQQEHALAIERLAPSLAALKVELCPSYMSEGLFWKIYFVLLHSRLNRSDADLLTTPEITQAREMLLQGIQTRTKTNSESEKNEPTTTEEVKTIPEQNTSSPPEPSSGKNIAVEDPSTTVPSTETDKHTVEEITEVKIVDKSVIQENPPSLMNKDKEVKSEEDKSVTHENPPSPINKDSKEVKSDEGKSVTHENPPFRSVDVEKYENEEEEEEEDDGDDDWLKEEEDEEKTTTNDDEQQPIRKSMTVPLGNDEDVSFSDLEDDDS